MNIIQHLVPKSKGNTVNRCAVSWRCFPWSFFFRNVRPCICSAADVDGAFARSFGGCFVYQGRFRCQSGPRTVKLVLYWKRIVKVVLMTGFPAVNSHGRGSRPQQAAHAGPQDVEMGRDSFGVHAAAARSERTEGPLGKVRRSVWVGV